MGKIDERYALGACSIYITDFDGSTIPANAEIETEANRLGTIKDGATADYKATVFDDSNDLGTIKIHKITQEDVEISFSLFSWNDDCYYKLCSTSSIEETATEVIISIGGLGKQRNQNYLVRLVQKDSLQGDMRYTIVGSNTEGFTLNTAKDKTSLIPCKFKATALDSTGTLLKIAIEKKTLGAITVTSVAGALSGATKITFTPAKSDGSTLKYKTAATVTLPVYNDVLTTGWTVWDGVSDITATTGNEIAIAEVDGDNKCKNVGKIAVVSKA